MKLTIDLAPVLLHLGPFAVSFYSLAVVTALVVGLWLTLREARRKGIPTEPVSELALWVFLGAMVGARLLHVVDRWDYYLANPQQILAVQNGGLAIIGGVLGGSLVGGLLAWRQGLPILRLFDAVAPGLVLGQAIGRLGCWVTGDAVGLPTDGSWGVVYLNPGAMPPKLGVAYQPVFFYEQLWDLAIFVVLWSVRKRLKTDGQVFALYLGLYAAGKFALTFLRTETIWLLGLQGAQVFSIGLFVVALVWALLAERQKPLAHAASLG
jgi:phosphatidylglycerol---prolipoprotein diacylglyceryl transferase